MSEWYRTMGISGVTKQEKGQELYNLYKKPIKDKGVNVPHFYNRVKDNIHQADLLFLPTDSGYRYALTVVDVASRTVDAEPLKSKKAMEVKEAFEKIYQRKNLTLPSRIEVDDGGEFKADVAKYFREKNVSVRVGLPDRRDSQALIERQNLTIGKALFMRQVAQEILTGEADVQWIEDLPTVISEMNKKAKKRKNPEPPSEPVCSGSNCNLLPEGTKVRVMLYAPRSAHNTAEKLHGKFRATDIRWNPVARKIVSILLKPGSPPMYLLNGPFKSSMYPEGVETIAYRRNELQVIPENEQPPPASVIRGKPNTYVIKSIIDHKKEGKKMMYEVLWKVGTKSWMEEADLQYAVPDMLRDYKENLKKEEK